MLALSVAPAADEDAARARARAAMALQLELLRLRQPKQVDPFTQPVAEPSEYEKAYNRVKGGERLLWYGPMPGKDGTGPWLWWRDDSGEPVFRRWEEPARPFRGITPGTTAPHAAGKSRSSPDIFPTVPTYIDVPAVRSGSTGVRGCLT